MPDQEWQEGIEQDERCSKTGVGDDGEECSKQVYLRNHPDKQYRRNGPSKSKSEEKGLPEAPMVSSCGHGDDEESLDEDADGEGVHGKARRIDLGSKNEDDAGRQFIVFVFRIIEGGGIGVVGLPPCATRCDLIFQ